MQNWKKLGLIFEVSNKHKQLISHASNPLAIHINNDIYRIFYSGRNAANQSSVGYVDIDIISQKIVNYPQIPSLQHGKENSFYSHGISIGNAYNVGNSTFILFMGWQNLEDQHWRGDIGRIKLIDNLQMKVTPDIPFIGIDHEDKVSLSYPFVLFDKGIYKMWYGSTIKWDAGNNEMTHVIKYATSVDAVTWVKHGLAIPFEIGIAQAFSKPSVLLDELGYHMWFSFRSGTGEKYRIGYAFSKDGENWVRDVKNSGIDVSKKGWDSDMVCYPYVFNHGDNTYMLYNGNNYGKDGFGLAILEKNKT